MSGKSGNIDDRSIESTKRVHPARIARIAVASCAVLSVTVASLMHEGAVGSLCTLCPIGFLEIGIASGEVPWGLLPGVLVMLAIAFALGKAFCAWACPTSLLRTLAEPQSVARERRGQSVGHRSDYGSQAVVFAVLLAVSFLVGFPVFCLICPIGLAFGVAYAVARTLLLWQPGWELVVFPLMLVAEVVLFRRWCSKICPVGFLLGLAGWLRGKLGFAIAPHVDEGLCLRGDGCHACASSCPEGIDAEAASCVDMRDCTLCFECRNACPARSIEIGLKRG